MKQKSENQKAFPRFLGILVVASLIGGVLGGLSGVAGYFWEDHTAFGAAFAHLLGAASPWAMAACAAVLLGLGLYQYRKSDTAFHGWDGEDEDVMQRAEERLSWALLFFRTRCVNWRLRWNLWSGWPMGRPLPMCRRNAP